MKLPTQKSDLLAVAMLLVEMLVLLNWAHDRNFITYRQDFGETFVAHQQAAQLSETASRFGLLHVERSPTGSELVYTHNVNLGTLYFALLRIVGISSLRADTILVFPVFLASLLVAYAAVKALTKSPSIATIFLALMIVDFANVGAFAFNALRAWHYLALFSAVYGSYMMAFSNDRKSFFTSVAIVTLGAFLSFGCGYDFFLVVVLIAILVPTLLCHSKQLIKSIPVVLVIFSAPFLLRQIEVIYWMGVRTWYVDFYTTFAIKVPFASKLIRIPSTNEIDSMYAHAGLFRPPALPTSNWIGIWQTLSPLVKLAVLPNYGLIGCLLLVVLTVSAPLFIFGPWRNSQRSKAVLLVAAYTIGSAIGLLIFAPFSLHVYMKHDFPLLAAGVHLAEASALVILFEQASVSLKKGLRTWGVSLLLLGVLVSVNAVVVQILNARYSKELDFGWMSLLMPSGSSKALLKSDVIAAVMEPPEFHTDLNIADHARVVSPDIAPWLLAYRSGLLVDKPIVNTMSLAGKETLLIYAPGDGWCNLDAREPDLSGQDWILKLRGQLATKERKSDLVPYVILHPTEATHSGDILHLEFFLPPGPGDSYLTYSPRLQVSTPDGHVHEFMNLVDCVAAGIRGGSVSLLYNAKYRTLDAYFLPPQELLTGRSTRLGIRAILISGPIVLSTTTTNVVISDDAPSQASIVRLPEPTTKQMVTAFSWCPVVKESDVGVGYAVLEIKPRN